MSAPRLLLALDYGGTKHSAALTTVPDVARGGVKWLAHTRTAPQPGVDAAADQAAMRALARQLLSQHSGQLAAVGVSFGGPVDAARGVVHLSHHVKGWENFPLRAALAQEFNVPVAIDNDANAAALGEWKFGAGKGCRSLLYVTVSTGIGGGWVLNGQVYGGAGGLAGEIGHTTVRPGGALCPCGRRGCLEAEACGPAIARKMRERLGAGGTEPFTGERVSAMANAGDALAQAVLDDAARMLGLGLANALNLMNPERVVLGGGVTKSGARYWQVVRTTAQANVLPQVRVEIVPAALGDDAPLWGAVAGADALR